MMSGKKLSNSYNFLKFYRKQINARNIYELSKKKGPQLISEGPHLLGGGAGTRTPDNTDMNRVL